MSDLISRADAIEALAQQWLFEASAESPYVNDDDIGEYRKLAEELFENVPSADAVEGKKSGSKLDVISRELAMERIANDNVLGGMERLNEYNNSTEFNEYLDGISDAITTIFCDVPSADAVSKYTEWLEKIIVEAETCEWLCEDTTDEEWCEKNCNYASIQAKCLRHLYEANKGGDDE